MENWRAWRKTSQSRVENQQTEPTYHVMMSGNSSLPSLGSIYKNLFGGGVGWGDEKLKRIYSSTHNLYTSLNIFTNPLLVSQKFETIHTPPLSLLFIRPFTLFFLTFLFQYYCRHPRRDLNIFLTPSFSKFLWTFP